MATAKTPHINFEVTHHIFRFRFHHPRADQSKKQHKSHTSKMKISHGALIFLAFETGRVSAGFSSYLSSLGGNPSAPRPASYAPSSGAKPQAAEVGIGNYLSNLDNGVLKSQPVLGDQQQPGITYAPSAPIFESESQASATSADYM